jgi:hypothetical protein
MRPTIMSLAIAEPAWFLHASRLTHCPIGYGPLKNAPRNNECPCDRPRQSGALSSTTFVRRWRRSCEA